MGKASLAFWTGENGCSSTTSTPSGPGFSACTAYEDCTSSLPVYDCTGTWNHTITTTGAGDVWAFFSSFKWPLRSHTERGRLSRLQANLFGTIARR